MVSCLVACPGLLLNLTLVWRVEEARSEWIPEYVCDIDMGRALDPWEKWNLPATRVRLIRKKAKLSSDPCVDAARGCRKIGVQENVHHSFSTAPPSLGIYSPKTALQRWLLPRLVKPVFLIQLYTINPASLFCSMSWTHCTSVVLQCLQQRALTTSTMIPIFCLCVCLSFFSSFFCQPVRSIPGAMPDRAPQVPD